jgi:hypothetical protein
MATTFSKTSPYYQTGTYSQFLDVMVNRSIPALVTDISFKITKSYEYRPDMLAYDLYKDASLWWVFAQRNPNVIKDPVFDFKPGVTIKIPKKVTIDKALGL